KETSSRLRWSERARTETDRANECGKALTLRYGFVIFFPVSVSCAIDIRQGEFQKIHTADGAVERIEKEGGHRGRTSLLDRGRADWRLACRTSQEGRRIGVGGRHGAGMS